LFVFGSVFLFSHPNISLAVEVNKHLQESVDVSQGMTLQLEHGDGHVTITPWEKDVVDIEVTYRYEFTGIGVNAEEYDFNLEVNRQGNTVAVRGAEDRPNRQLFISSQRHEYAYHISAPAYLVLDIHGDDGNVTVRNWRNDVTLRGDDGSILLSNINAGNLNISGNDGDMFLTDLTGNLTLQSDDGELELSGIRGDISVDVNDGDVEMNNIQGALRVTADDGNTSLSDSEISDGRIRTNDGDVRVGRSSGNFTISGDDARVRLDEVSASRLEIDIGDGDVWTYLLAAENMDVNIRTEDGDIELRLANDIAAELILESEDGNIDQEFTDISDVRQGEDWFTGILNNGGGSIRVRTDGGDIRVRTGL